MNVTPTELAEIFAEAAAKGRREPGDALRVVGARSATDKAFQRVYERTRDRKLARELRAERAARPQPPLPLATVTRLACAVCGGVIEKREGSTRLIHMGRRCRAPWAACLAHAHLDRHGEPEAVPRQVDMRADSEMPTRAG